MRRTMILIALIFAFVVSAGDTTMQIIHTYECGDIWVGYSVGVVAGEIRIIVEMGCDDEYTIMYLRFDEWVGFCQAFEKAEIGIADFHNNWDDVEIINR